MRGKTGTKIESEWLQATVPPDFNNDLSKIRQKVDSYQQHQHGKSIQQVKTSAHEDVHRRKFAEYLRSFRLTDTEIPGVTAEERKLLVKKKGVRTAAEQLM